MKWVREDWGEELSPKAKRLLRSASPIRAMTPAEKVYAQAFVASLAKRSPLLLAFELGRSQWATVVLAALCVILGIKLEKHAVDNTSAPMVMIADTPQRAEANHLAFASIPKELASPRDLQSSTDTPGFGDICGQRVCESMPSCCERNWDETCDQKLLELSLLPLGQASMNMGRCYWHDRAVCPACACPAYVKRIEVFARDGDNGVSLGYDGITGCVRSTEAVLANLKWMCVRRYCET
jgi:hypothetical protein